MLTDISGEHIVSIFRVREQARQECCMKQAANTTLYSRRWNYSTIIHFTVLIYGFILSFKFEYFGILIVVIIVIAQSV
jgi:hypothetical protein